MFYLETITSDWLISFSNTALCLYIVNANLSTDSCHNPNTAVLHSPVNHLYYYKRSYFTNGYFSTSQDQFKIFP